MIEGWKLRCELDGDVRVHRVELDPMRPDDPDDVRRCAVITAAWDVMSLANRSLMWSKGKIQLIDPGGLIVEEMEAR